MNGLAIWTALLLAWVAASAGMAALAFSMDRHFEQVTGSAEVPGALRWMARSIGCVLLGSSFWACMATGGVGVAVVAWFGFLTIGAIPVVLWLARLVRRGAMHPRRD